MQNGLFGSFCYHAMDIYIYIYIYIYIVYRVLSIYRVLPGFREFAVFEKSKRFFYIFFGWVLHRGGQGPGKGPNIRSLQSFVYI